MRCVGVWNIVPSASAVNLFFLYGRLVSGNTFAVMSRISIVATPTPINTKTEIKHK